MKLIIGGDIVANESNIMLFKTGNLEKIMGQELLNHWNKSDFRFFNLEAPLTKSNKKINKSGANLSNDPDILEGLAKMNPTCVFLANNHIMDYGEEGLKDTLYYLNKKNINWIGVGNSLNETKKYFVIKKESIKVGVYNCCETEFSIATENKCGANPFDIYTIDNDIKKIKSICDYLIVIYHGGKEYYRYPSPMLQKKCRKMIEFGANIVLCQHSHCIGCKEEYNNGIIVYGQGNFIFNKKSNEFWNNSLLVEVNITKEKFEINYLPIVRTIFGTRIADKNESAETIKSFIRRSNDILKKDFIENNYSLFSREYVESYIKPFYSRKIISKVCFKFFKIKPSNYISDDSLWGILNSLQCDDHRELFKNGIKEIIKERMLKKRRNK